MGSCDPASGELTRSARSRGRGWRWARPSVGEIARARRASSGTVDQRTRGRLRSSRPRPFPGKNGSDRSFARARRHGFPVLGIGREEGLASPPHVHTGSRFSARRGMPAGPPPKRCAVASAGSLAKIPNSSGENECLFLMTLVLFRTKRISFRFVL